MPRGKAGGSINARKVDLDEPIRLRERALLESPSARGDGRPVPLSHIASNPRNLRAEDLGTPDEREEMRTSLQDLGLVQALVVCDVQPFLDHYPQHTNDLPDGIRWVIIAGHRRLLAAQELGWEQIRIEVQNDFITRLDEVFLDENDKRKPLTPFQEGEGYRRLRVDQGLSLTEIAKRRGKSKAHISKRIRLLELPDEARALVLSAELGVDLAYNLLAAASDAAHVAPAFRLMVERNLDPATAIQEITHPSQPTPPAVIDADEASAVSTSTDRSGDAITETVSARNGAPVITPEQRTSTDLAAGQTTQPGPPADPDAKQRITSGKARAAVCAGLVAGYGSEPDAVGLQIAATTITQAKGAILKVACRWFAGPDVPPAAAESIVEEILEQGAPGEICRLAYAVALAEGEARAGDRRRTWDAATVRHVRHLIEVGVYTPATEWERRQLKLAEPLTA